MESGTEVKIGGQYTCLYHLKNKIKLKAGSIFPTCNFARLNCKGEWHLLKEIKEKTWEEHQAALDRRRQSQDKRKWIDKDAARARKAPKFNKWDFEKW